MCVVQQTKIISGFYISYVVLQVIYLLIGNLFFDPDTHFKCENGNVVPLTNPAALYGLFQDLIILIFSLMVYIVFYYLPYRFNLIATSRHGIINRVDSKATEQIHS